MRRSIPPIPTRPTICPMLTRGHFPPSSTTRECSRICRSSTAPTTALTIVRHGDLPSFSELEQLRATDPTAYRQLIDWDYAFNVGYRHRSGSVGPLESSLPLAVPVVADQPAHEDYRRILGRQQPQSRGPWPECSLQRRQRPLAAHSPRQPDRRRPLSQQSARAATRPQRARLGSLAQPHPVPRNGHTLTVLEADRGSVSGSRLRRARTRASGIESFRWSQNRAACGAQHRRNTGLT